MMLASVAFSCCYASGEQVTDAKATSCLTEIAVHVNGTLDDVSALATKYGYKRITVVSVNQSSLNLSLTQQFCTDSSIH